MGYKAGPSPPEPLLAEQSSAVAEPAEPESKSIPRPRHIQPLTVEEELRKEEDEEDGRACDVAETQIGVPDEERKETKGCFISEPQNKASGLPPCTFPSPASDPACPAGTTLKVDLSPGCSGQKASLEESQRSKEQENDGKEDEKEESDPAECFVSVPVESEEEEDGCKAEENVEVVEDEEESEKSPNEELVGQICSSPAPPQSPEPASSPVANTAAQLEGAYIRSLELLIAAALCATRDAMHPPAPAGHNPCPSSHHGMEILGELAELEIQQRRRETEGKGPEGKLQSIFNLIPDLFSLQTCSDRPEEKLSHLRSQLGNLRGAVSWSGLI